MLAQPPLWVILVAFVCALGPLVFFHELGHYLVARWFGVGAESFSIGFGHEVTGWTDKRGTRWKVGWLPLGGYVKFVGDEHEASAAGDISGLTEEQKAKAFQLRPVYQRFLIVLAGPLANFLLAILIFAAFFAIYGAPRTPPVVGQIAQQSAAEAAGLKPGDRIVSVGGRHMETFSELRNYVFIRPGETVALEVERAGRTRSLEIRIPVVEEADNFGQKFRRGQLGILPRVIFERVAPLELIPAATSYTIEITRTTLDALWQMLTGRRSVKELGGFMKIAQVAGQQASLGPVEFISLLALLSINLGFINLLPVPVLDGGHLLFYGIEAVRRRPVSARAQDWAFRGGLALILALLILTTVNDLSSFGLWDRLERLIG